jgi:4-hydroxybenzoate polyprenyltransferase
MFCLQAGIGAANDRIDVDVDADRKPGKPIPAGLVGPSGAERVLAVALALGLGLSALSGLAVFLVAVLGTGIGLAYDLRLKGTPWSWLPFAVGIPLLPVFGWLGASGGVLPGPVIVLVVVAVPAGTALALANALADVERDRAAGVSSVAVALGPRRTWVIGATLQGLAIAVAVAVIVAGDWHPGVFATAAAGAALIGAGLLLGRSEDTWRRERGWETQALGQAALAVAWLLQLVATGTL